MRRQVACGPREYARSWWSVLDVTVVVTGWVMAFVRVNNGGVSALRCLRVMRPLRSISFLPGLRLLVGTIFEVLPNVGSIVTLLTYLLFLFGIVAVSVFGDALSFQCVAVDASGAPVYSSDDTSSGFVGRAPEVLGSDSLVWQTCSPKPRAGAFTCPAGYACLPIESPNLGITKFNNILWASLTIFRAPPPGHRRHPRRTRAGGPERRRARPQVASRANTGATSATG